MADDPELDDLLIEANGSNIHSNNNDVELSNLLDSALKDFAPSQNGANLNYKKESETETKDETLKSDQGFPFLNELMKGFATFTQAKNQSSQNCDPTQEIDFLKDLMKEDPEMMGQFEYLAQAASKVDDTEASQKEFSTSLTSTLSALTQNMESLQGTLSEEGMMTALAGLNLNDRPDEGELRDDISLDGDDDDAGAAAGPSPSFLPMLGGMMKSILSKEVLHPSLQEIAAIYPSWLEENKSTLSDEDFVRFEKQFIIIAEVCRDFEQETESTSEIEKQQRFERVLIHMQKMHELGQPPKELLLKLDPSIETIPGAVPMMPQLEQCCIM